MTGVLGFLWVAMEIQAAGACPAAAEVEAKLAPLFPPGFAATAPDRAVIVEDADGAVSVALARPDGTTISRRRLPRAASCAEQAETVAVTLAVWEAQIHPEISLRLDRLGATASAPPATDSPPPRDAPAAVALRPASAPATESATVLAVGAAALGAFQPDVAPGGRLDATLGAAGRPWRWRLSVAALGTHTLDLPPGRASWWRLYAALGADYAVPFARRWDVALGAAGVIGLANIEGSGYTVDRQARTVDLGAEALLRVDVRLGAVRPWLGLALVTWLREQTVAVTNVAAAPALPRVEPLIALGADFCWQP
jgi:hypothetical protein